MQRQVNNLNAPKIFFFRDSKAPTSSITLKHLNRIHRDMDHPDYTQMATECVRLGHKVSKSVELRISRVIQECQICKDEDRTFSHGHGKKYKTAFNTDVLVRREKVIGDYYYTELFSFECMDTGSTIARYVNDNKYKSRYEMLNHVAMEYWSYGEYGDGFGMPRNAFFTADPTDDIQSLRRAGRSDSIKWGRSDLKLGKFRFSDFLDCTDCAKINNLGARLSERVFVYNKLLSPGTGYTPQQFMASAQGYQVYFKYQGTQMHFSPGVYRE